MLNAISRWMNRLHLSGEDTPSNKVSHSAGCEALFEGEAPLTADLVFVHGLGGHRRDTWTKDGVCWPQELLSKENAISHVRILTFGYDTNVGGPKGRTSLNSLFERSIDLLNELSRERRRDAWYRPIIFIAYSFGGLIVKDALHHSEMVGATKSHLAQIVSATRGVIFLGTPHRGSGTTSLANLVAAVAQLALQSPNRNLIGDLKRDSQVLDRIRDNFSRLLDKQTFTVWSFEEELALAGAKKVVWGDSATIGDARENHGSIYADHIGLTKFSTRDDTEYKKVVYAIEMLLEKSVERETAVANQGIHTRARTPPCPIPLPSNFFTGQRKYLEKLRQYFAPHGHQLQQQKQFVLYGMAGVGKSQICMKFAEECANQFKYIFWIDTANSDAAELSIEVIADCHEAQAAGVVKSTQSVLQWISWNADPWLLVIDNADGDSDMIRKYIPHGSYGNVLISSRNPDMCHYSPEAYVEVEMMDEEDAITLLLKTAFLAADSEVLGHTSRIVKELYCLPLAVGQAGALIAGGFCNINSYLQMYASCYHKLLDQPSFKNASNYERAVYGTWELSFKALSTQANSSHDKCEGERAKSAIILLQIFAFFYHDNITEEILKQAAYSYNHYPDANLLSSHVNIFEKLLYLDKEGRWNNPFFKDGIQILLFLSLVRRGAFVYVYSIHPLVHWWSRERMTLSEQPSQYHYARELLCSSIMWKHPVADYTFYQTLSLHIKANNQYASEAGISDALMDMSHLASAYNDQGMWKEAEELEAKVTETRKKVLGPEPLDNLSGMNSLALTYRSQGKWKEAEKLQVKVMETRKRVLGVEHPGTLTSMANLASTYWNQERWKEAEELQVTLMETSLRVLGAEHPSTLTAMHNLASTYTNQGRWNEAEKLELKVMETSLRVLGTEHPSTLTTMGNLASIYQNQGRWKEAEELELKVMETRKKVLGSEHPDTLTSMVNLASTYNDQGKWKLAERLEARVMDIRKQILGSNHPDTLSSMVKLASTYNDQRKWKEAEELETRVMETRKRMLGVEHPDTLTSMVNLAFTYNNQGKWKLAEKLGVWVVQTRKRVFGAEHPDTLTSMVNLASTYSSQARWKDAEELEVIIMETCLSLFGMEHPQTLTTMSNLASTYKNQWRLKEAEELEAMVMETSIRVLGPEHSNTITSMGNLVSTYRNQGKLKEAEELQVMGMETSLRLLGAENPHTLTSISNLASTYWNQGKLKEAEKLQAILIETKKRVLGAEHPDVLKSMNNLASIYLNLGKLKEAEELQIVVIETRKRVFGAEHPDTLTSLRYLALTYKIQRRFREAEELEVAVEETSTMILETEHSDTTTYTGNLVVTSRNQSQLEALGLHDLTGEIAIRSSHYVAGGAYADVWQGEYKGQGVAIKAPRPAHVLNVTPEILEKQVQREHANWAKLQHKNILPLLGYAYFTEYLGPAPCLISPWMQYGTAIEFVCQRKAEAQPLKLLLGLAEGLEYIHEHFIVHGDIRGNNILVSSDGEACIADFGYSRQIGGITTSITLHGSFRWMAPELHSPESFGLEHGNAQQLPCDVWAFGMTVLELLTGCEPYDTLGTHMVSVYVLNEQIPSIPDSWLVTVPKLDYLWQLCRNCWKFDPSLRPSMGEVLSKFKAYRSACGDVNVRDPILDASEGGWTDAAILSDATSQTKVIASGMHINGSSPVINVQSTELAAMPDNNPAQDQPQNGQPSAVDLMKLLKLDSSLAGRRALAIKLGYIGDLTDTAKMNVWLYKEVMERLAKNRGVTPAELRN